MSEPLFFLKFSSAFHLLSALAYLNSLDSKKIQYRAYLHYDDYWKKNNIDNFYLSAIQTKRITLLDRNAYRAELEKSKAAKQSYTVFSTNYGYELPFSGRKSIIIDDGLGAYRTDLLRLFKTLWRENITTERLARLPILYLKLCVKITLATLYKAPRFGLLEKPPLPPLPNATYIYNAISVIERLSKLRRTTVYPKITSPVVLFLTQPAVELRWLSPAEYKALLLFLEKWAQEECNASLLIKRHPADSFDYSQHTEIKFPGLAEELFYTIKNRIHAVVSIASTSLITAKLLFDIKSYNIKIENDPFSNKDHFLHEILNKYTISLNTTANDYKT